jgi:histone acetyltransferase (RNA polymerase elongator complex component)
LDILSQFAVKTIELGLQSMDNEVLSASKRGHDTLQAEKACEMIKKRGFSLIGQMMIGLPQSSVEKEVYTAGKICEMCADGARIYPTVVFYDTELCAMMQDGKYTALTNEEAVERTKEALKIFVENDVPCIRVGLQSGENLTDESALDTVRLDHYKGLLHRTYSFPRALRPAAVHATRLGSLPSL